MGALPAVVILLLGYSAMVAEAQRGVCYHSVATVQRTSHIVYTAIRQTYTFQCWFLRCSGTKYRAVSLIQYRAVYQMQQRCCNGFKGDGYLCEPIKSGVCEACEAPFACIANNTCVCSNPGLTGPNCIKGINAAHKFLSTMKESTRGEGCPVLPCIIMLTDLNPTPPDDESDYVTVVGTTVMAN